MSKSRNTSREDQSKHQHEEEEISERTAPPGEVLYQAIYGEAEHELARSNRALAWSGIAAGLSMGFSFLAQAFLAIHLPDAAWASLITPLGYTVGFLIVILGRQQLFTENTLTPILPLLTERRWKTLVNVARLWSIVLVTNLAGGFAFAWVLGNTNAVDAEVSRACAELARVTMTMSFWTTVLRGIFAGWLIALMVWLLPSAEQARIWVIIILSYLVGLAAFPHVIAGGVEVFYLVATGEIGFLRSITDYIVPTLIGNTVGGVALVAAIAHAQFKAQGRGDHDKT